MSAPGTSLYKIKRHALCPLEPSRIQIISTEQSDLTAVELHASMFAGGCADCLGFRKRLFVLSLESNLSNEPFGRGFRMPTVEMSEKLEKTEHNDSDLHLRQSLAEYSS